MTRLIEIVPAGVNWHTESSDQEQVRASLSGLLAQLSAEGLRWADVGLLWLASSRRISARGAEGSSLHRVQNGFDRVLLDELTEFCEQQNGWPALVGSTVKAAFCSANELIEPDIGDGLMWIAFVHRLVPRVTIGVEVMKPDQPQRGDAGQLALGRAVDGLTAQINQQYGRSLTVEQACEGAVGLIFTSGSGHIAATAGGVDFRDCYGVGQGLLQAAGRIGLTVVGGCASNRLPEMSQCLYYSDPPAAGRRTYHATYSYGAVVAVLPAAHVLVQLDHPYRRVSKERLTLDFHPHEKYSEGRFFCVSKINGQTPREFLEQHWPEIDTDEFQKMVDNRLPIPAKPKAHYFSIASSPNASPRSIWPNIPIYFEVLDDGSTLLRLVRAESEEAYFYPIRMTPDGLVANAEELSESMQLNSGDGDSLVAFLCESRKYVLEDLDSNAEVERLFQARPTAGKIIGVYLNGEYSTGQERSIGYHNYSQIGSIFTDVSDPGLMRLIHDQ